MRSLLEIKTPFRSLARSYILTTPESSNIGILEVHLYRLSLSTCLSLLVSMYLSVSSCLSVPICLSVPVLCSDWLYCNQGDWVWLKKIPVERTVTAVKQSTQNLFGQVQPYTVKTLSKHCRNNENTVKTVDTN